MSVVLEGRGLLESARWHDGRLYVADWSVGEVLVLEDGKAEVVARLNSLPLCFDWLPDGRMLLVSSNDGRLLTQEPDGELKPYAELGRPGWNEVVTGQNGNAYVNGAAYDPATGFGPGGIVLVTPDGQTKEVADDISFPNGMLITQSRSELIIADSYRHCLLAFDIDEDSGLGRRRIWADLGDGVPDGICAAEEGAIWYADVPNRRCVKVAEGGATLQTVDLDRGAFSCALNGTTLFVAAAQFLGMHRPDPVTPQSGQVIAMSLQS